MAKAGKKYATGLADPNRNKCPCGKPDCPCGSLDHAGWSVQGFGCRECNWKQTPPSKESTS